MKRNFGKCINNYATKAHSEKNYTMQNLIVYYIIRIIFYYIMKMNDINIQF